MTAPDRRRAGRGKRVDFSGRRVIGRKKAGVGGVAVSDGNGGGIYTVAYAANTTSTITPAALTVSAGPVTKSYDGTRSAEGRAGEAGRFQWTPGNWEKESGGRGGGGERRQRRRDLHGGLCRQHHQHDHAGGADGERGPGHEKL